MSGAAIIALLRVRKDRARWLLESLRAFVEASRHSGNAVLAAMEREFRALEANIENVFVFAPSGNELACVFNGGVYVEHVRHLRLHRSDSHLPARAVRTGGRAVVGIDGVALLPSDRFAIAVPMFDRRSLLAVTYVSSKRLIAASTGDAIAAAIEHAAVPYAIALERESDRADAMQDGLTGLLASAAFRHRLRDEVERSAAARGHRVLCLWFVDADRFKDVNDRFGHPRGDAVLRAMAMLLESHLISDVDVATRNGGDEFCALLRGASKSRAIERAQAFCEAVRGHDFGLPVRVTASIGVATYPYDASTSGALMEIADAAMYHSKRNGRNQVSFVSAPGAFASVRPEAASELSRSHSRCRSNFGESFMQR